MFFFVYILPLAIMIFVVARQAKQIWKGGLFLALIQLGISILSAFLSFGLTRLFLNPARVDLFGLGALLVKWVPGGFIPVMPYLEDFLRALPTAFLALISFTLVFDLLRIQGNKLLKKLDEKYKWSEKLLKIKKEKIFTALVGVLIAIMCLVPDLIILTGTLPFAGNMLYCAKTATGAEIFTSLGDVTHQLQKNPVIRLCKALGAEKVYFELTAADRNGEPFSVGQELNELSDAFVGILPVFGVLDREGHVPTAQEIRALPDALGRSEKSLGLCVGLARSYGEKLGDSDAIWILSQLMGTTPERFEEYLGQLTMENARQDLESFCQMAALLADRGLIPESGSFFDKSALEDAQLQEQIRQELGKNPSLSAFFGQ